MKPSCSVCLLLVGVGLQCKAVRSIELISLERQQEMLEEYKEEAMESENVETIRWDFGDYNPDPPPDDGEGEAEEDQMACATDLAWHPNYDAGWKNGFCIYTRTCDSPSFSSELECCEKVRTIEFEATPPPEFVIGAFSDKRNNFPKLFALRIEQAYGGQTSKYCLSKLESPPTYRPTALPTVQPTSGPTVYTEYWYPDYEVAWKVSYCLSTERGQPVPKGRPLYLTNADCCLGYVRLHSGGRVYTYITSHCCFCTLSAPMPGRSARRAFRTWRILPLSRQRVTLQLVRSVFFSYWTLFATVDAHSALNAYLVVSPTTEIAPFYYPRYEGKALAFPHLSPSFAHPFAKSRGRSPVAPTRGLSHSRLGTGTIVILCSICPVSSLTCPFSISRP